MKTAKHCTVSCSVSPEVRAKLDKVARNTGVSVAGITRLVLEESLGVYSDINTHRPHKRGKRVISDVTIKIAKGIKVRIV